MTKGQKLSGLVVVLCLAVIGSVLQRDEDASMAAIPCFLLAGWVLGRVTRRPSCN